MGFSVPQIWEGTQTLSKIGSDSLLENPGSGMRKSRTRCLLTAFRRSVFVFFSEAEKKPGEDEPRNLRRFEDPWISVCK